MLRLAENRDSISVVNDQFGVPTFTKQAVLETWELLNESKDGIYHLGSEGVISWYDFAKKIFELNGLKIEVQPVSSSEYPTMAKRPLFSKLSTKKIENAINTAPINWEDGLKDLLNELEK